MIVKLQLITVNSEWMSLLQSETIFCLLVDIKVKTVISGHLWRLNTGILMCFNKIWKFEIKKPLGVSSYWSRAILIQQLVIQIYVFLIFFFCRSVKKGAAALMLKMKQYICHVIFTVCLFVWLYYYYHYYYYLMSLVLLARCIVQSFYFKSWFKLTNCRIISNKHGACIWNYCCI